MSGEQRVWTASILSVVILAIYTHVIEGKMRVAQTPAQLAAIQSQVRAAPPPQLQDIIFTQQAQHEELIVIESEQLVLRIGKQSAAVHAVQLKTVRDLLTKADLVIGNGEHYLVAPRIGDGAQAWSFVSQTRSSATWSWQAAEGLQYELVVSLDEQSPTYWIGLKVASSSTQTKEVPVKIFTTWVRSDQLAGRYNMLEVAVFSKKESGWQKSHQIYRGAQRQARAVPRGTQLLTLSERYFCQAIKPDEKLSVSTTLLPSQSDSIAAELQGSLALPPSGTEERRFQVFIGQRDYFKLRDAGFERAFPIGFLGQIGLGIVLLLRWIASLVHNYGVAILLLSLIVTTTLAPFTLISVRSMKKMQQLQPKMDQLKKKYADDQTRMNKEMFALFKQNKVSPASGCLPMLLQMPIFFAFWSAITHSVEFRGAGFLWIKDLSLPDRLARLPGGFELNILPIAMAAAMFFQTKMSQSSNSSAPGANVFSGPMMSVIFGVMFYQVPSCLVLYWLTNSLISLAIYKTVKT